MVETVRIVILLLVLLAAVTILARKLNFSRPILLVLAGVALALSPAELRIELSPEFVLLIVLPPLIYSAGVAMSWREFRFNLRPIILLAVGCVVFTTVAVAAVAHYALGFPWAVGFVLGAIVSPPDVVAPLAIARRLGVPRRLLTVLEGEGLVNDATALILYRFAVAAVSTGLFSLPQAGATFVVIAVGETLFGIAVAWAILRLRHWAQDPRIELTLSLLTPYVAFWIPEHIGGSGVLATVAAGLYVSWNGPRLISSATRLQGFFFWDLVIYLTEGLTFLVTGLQAWTVLERLRPDETLELLASAAIICVVVVAVRFIWVFPATYIPRWASPSLARRDPAPPWQAPFALSAVGIRGVVSLAAALALPFATAGGAPFPERDKILFLTFCVILVTLVGQGLLFQPIIRWLGLDRRRIEEQERERREEYEARRAAVRHAMERIEHLAAAGSLPHELLEPLRANHHDRLRLIERDGDGGPEGHAAAQLRQRLELELIAAEREHIYRLLHEGRLGDAARRRIERELDLEEARVRQRSLDPQED